jgi:hypothetical protein
METKLLVPRAILVGIQVPSVDDIAHAAGIEELSRLVKTLGYEVIGTMSQKRDELDGATVLGKGRLEELAAITGGTGVVGSKAILQKSKARERFEGADEKKPDAPQIEPDSESLPNPEFVIVDHEISPSQTRNLERATGAQVLDCEDVGMARHRQIDADLHPPSAINSPPRKMPHFESLRRCALRPSPLRGVQSLRCKHRRRFLRRQEIQQCVYGARLR